jgi:hypothetical protein
MNPQARAIIRWIPTARGGRLQPPPDAAGYTTPALFERHSPDQVGAWSLRIMSAIQLHGPEVIDARISFVVAEAPHQILAEGERFLLPEGRKIVGKGVIIPDDIRTSDQISDFELALLG